MLKQTPQITPKNFFLPFLLCSWALNLTEQRCGLAMALVMCQLHPQASESNKWLKNPQQPFFPATCRPGQAGSAPARPKPPACPRMCPGCTPPREKHNPNPRQALGSEPCVPSQHRAGLRETSTKLKIIALRGRAGGSPRAGSWLLALKYKPLLMPTCEQSQQPEGHQEQPEPRAQISHISVPRVGKHPTCAFCRNSGCSHQPGPST